MSQKTETISKHTLTPKVVKEEEEYYDDDDQLQVVEEEKKTIVAESPKPKISRWIIAGILLVVSLVLLMLYFYGDRIMRYFFGGRPAEIATNKDSKQEENNAPKVIEHNDPPNLHAVELDPRIAAKNANETPASMLKVAKDLKEKGYVLWGVSTCRYTVYQRIMFGDEKSEARKIIESLYVECRDMMTQCPGIRVFPTWIHKPSGNHAAEGCLSMEELRNMMTSTEAKLNKVEIVDVTDKPSESVQKTAPPKVEHAVAVTAQTMDKASQDSGPTAEANPQDPQDDLARMAAEMERVIKKTIKPQPNILNVYEKQKNMSM